MTWLQIFALYVAIGLLFLIWGLGRDELRLHGKFLTVMILLIYCVIWLPGMVYVVWRRARRA